MADAAPAPAPVSIPPGTASVQVDRGQTGPDAPPKAPEKILGKFASQDELAKAYVELEKKLGAPKAPEAKPADGKAPEAKAPEAKPAEKAPEAKAPESPEDAAKKAVAAKGIDFDALQNEYAQNGGKLTEARLKELEAAGIPKSAVDAYVEGQVAKAALTRQEILRAADLDDAKFDEMSKWAQKHLRPEELTAFDEAIAKAPLAQQKFLLGSLAARWRNEGDHVPERIEGGPPSRGPEGYQSMQEMLADMKDPRYAKDPAFRAKVEAKLKNSKNI